MFSVTATFESEIDDLLGTYESEIDKFSGELTNCVLTAGDKAVEAMQANHPYEDQTYLLSAGMRCQIFGRQTRWTAEAVVTFLAPYAKFVNDGTKKCKAYPFLPQGEHAAEKMLEQCVSHKLDVLCDALARGK